MTAVQQNGQTLVFIIDQFGVSFDIGQITKYEVIHYAAILMFRRYGKIRFPA